MSYNLSATSAIDISLKLLRLVWVVQLNRFWMCELKLNLHLLYLLHLLSLHLHLLRCLLLIRILRIILRGALNILKALKVLQLRRMLLGEVRQDILSRLIVGNGGEEGLLDDALHLFKRSFGDLQEQILNVAAQLGGHLDIGAIVLLRCLFGFLLGYLALLLGQVQFIAHQKHYDVTALLLMHNVEPLFGVEERGGLGEVEDDDCDLAVLDVGRDE